MGSSLVVQRLGLGTFTAVTQVQSLVWELRSHIKLLHAVAKKTSTQTEYPGNFQHIYNFFKLKNLEVFGFWYDLKRRETFTPVSTRKKLSKQKRTLLDFQKTEVIEKTVATKTGTAGE